MVLVNYSRGYAVIFAFAYTVGSLILIANFHLSGIPLTNPVPFEIEKLRQNKKGESERISNFQSQAGSDIVSSRWVFRNAQVSMLAREDNLCNHSVDVSKTPSTASKKAGVLTEGKQANFCHQTLHWCCYIWILRANSTTAKGTWRWFGNEVR